MTNWIPKSSGRELGVNYRETFRVDDAVLVISHDNWLDFNGEFGHISCKQSFSHYRFRVERRFVGDQVNNSPSWVYRNNTVMLHDQSSQSMTLDQEFPASIEVQLLGGNGEDDKTTANICSPATHYGFVG